MERIIINERDNTSNIESLSSYDVVYVPGFSATPVSDYFRVPTLVTTTYQFTQKFGGSCPVFTAPQYYPECNAGGVGFPKYAIPDGFVARTFTAQQIDNFSGEEAKIADSGSYTKVTIAVTSDNYKDYYLATETDGTWKMSKPTSFPTGTGLKWYASVDPASLGWWEGTTGNEVACTSTTIDLSKTYWTLGETGSQPMFMSGAMETGWRYAYYLLSLGVPVYYEQMNNATTNTYVKDSDGTITAGICLDSIYEGLESRFNEASGDYSFDSVGDYSIKYITSGGYPTFEYGPRSSSLMYDDTAGIYWGTSSLAQEMAAMAANRGECVALIDHTNFADRPIEATNRQSVFSCVNGDGTNQYGPGIELTTGNSGTDTYAAMFTPWYVNTNSMVMGDDGDETSYNAQMPASLAFLSALAYQIKNYNPWLAVAGVSRGSVPNCGGLHTTAPLTNNIADSYQSVLDGSTTGTRYISINPITYIKNYGYRIWGNRTLRNNKSGVKATSFLNIRDVVSDVKKKLFDASQQLMFEQNNDVLWVNFKSLVSPLLNQMVSNYILDDYKLIKYTTDPETGNPVPAYKLLAVVQIVPIDSVEVFELTVEINNSEISSSTTIAE